MEKDKEAPSNTASRLFYLSGKTTSNRLIISISIPRFQVRKVHPENSTTKSKETIKMKMQPTTHQCTPLSKIFILSQCLDWRMAKVYGVLIVVSVFAVMWCCTKKEREESARMWRRELMGRLL